MAEPLIFELSSPGLKAYDVEEPGIRDAEALADLSGSAMWARQAPALPQVSESMLVRHFTRLSELNFHVDKGLYPLGSCTMKYNPKSNERLAALPGFTCQHPLQDVSGLQGTLAFLYELQLFLAGITGLPAVSLQPCAGAHGELTSLMMIKAYWRDRNEDRNVVVVPDSAHGTNPASASMCGFRVEEVPSAENGCVNLEEFMRRVDENCAAVMLTNPNTLGLFEEGILDIAAHCKDVGARLYCDGANMNALVGRARPGDMGFDIMHLNLHKTFSTPHGGGGPGSGPVCCSEELAPYLPVPRVVKGDRGFELDDEAPRSIGPVHTFLGNVSVALKAYAYLLSTGMQGLREVSEAALLNANYLRVKLRELLPLPYDRPCMHEFVLSGKPSVKSADNSVHTLDIAKRLLDLGFHAPTIYFPLIVEEALMIEPTETESKRELDRFIAAFEQIIRERESDPSKLHDAPLTTPVRRLDETTAARRPDLRFSGCLCPYVKS